MLAQQPTLERERGLRDVVAREIGAAIDADLVAALEVFVPADRAEHDPCVRVPFLYSTVHVSPPLSTFSRSPTPFRATAAVNCSSMSVSCVGRETALSTPTGTG